MKNKLIAAFLMFATAPFFADSLIQQPTQDISSLVCLQSIKIAILEGIVMGHGMKDLMIEEQQINPKAYEFTLEISDDLYSSNIYQDIITDKLNSCFAQIEEALNDKTKSLFDDIDFYTYQHPAFPGSFMYSIIPLDEEIKAQTYELHKSIYIQHVTDYCNDDKNWPFKNVTFDEYIESENTQIFEMIIFTDIFNAKLLEKIDVKIREELKARQ